MLKIRREAIDDLDNLISEVESVIETMETPFLRLVKAIEEAKHSSWTQLMEV